MIKSIGDRMKDYYEFPYKIALPMRMPVIIRVDGKAFHSFTKDMGKPFDQVFLDWMATTARYLAKEVQNCQIAYAQSDEISLLVHNYQRLESSAWFDNDLQKIASVSAGLASSCFTHVSGRLATFDARAFVIPEDEVANYFIWRQEDAKRNGISMVAQSLYTHQELNGKKGPEMRGMIEIKRPGAYELLNPHLRHGYAIHRQHPDNNWFIDYNIPDFKTDREFINKLLAHE